MCPRLQATAASHKRGDTFLSADSLFLVRAKRTGSCLATHSGTSLRNQAVLEDPKTAEALSEAGLNRSAIETALLEKITRSMSPTAEVTLRALVCP